MILFNNGYLSNWYHSPFTINEICYDSIEQYMMYQKALTFNDMETAEKILKTKNFREVKILGRQVKNYNDIIWNGIRQIIVYEGLLAKFSQNEDIKNQLLNTGNEILVECSSTDKIWAISLTIDNVDSKDITKWKGQNILGFSLMKVRDKLRCS